MAPSGSTSCRSGASTAVPKSSVFGTRYSVPLIWASSVPRTPESRLGRPGAIMGAPQPASSQRIDPRRAKQPAGLDERQPDQRRRVVRFDGIEQRDAERLALGAASAIVRLLELQVALDLLIVQALKTHRHRHPHAG